MQLWFGGVVSCRIIQQSIPEFANGCRNSTVFVACTGLVDAYSAYAYNWRKTDSIVIHQKEPWLLPTTCQSTHSLLKFPDPDCPSVTGCTYLRWHRQLSQNRERYQAQATGMARWPGIVRTANRPEALLFLIPIVTNPGVFVASTVTWLTI